MEGREPRLCGRCHDRGALRGCLRRFPQNHWLGKGEGLNFMSSWNQHVLKPGLVMVNRFGWDRTRRALGCSWRDGWQTTEDTEW